MVEDSCFTRTTLFACHLQQAIVRLVAVPLSPMQISCAVQVVSIYLNPSVILRTEVHGSSCNLLLPSSRHCVFVSSLALGPGEPLPAITYTTELTESMAPHIHKIFTCIASCRYRPRQGSEILVSNLRQFSWIPSDKEQNISETKICQNMTDGFNLMGNFLMDYTVLIQYILRKDTHFYRSEKESILLSHQLNLAHT